MPGDYPDYTDIMVIVGAEIMVPIDVQGAYIMMPVDIQAQYVTLEIDIVAQTVGNIDINIAAQSIDKVAVNIAASAVTLDINIKTSAITLNVDITAQTIGNLTIDIKTQSVGVYTEPDWQVAAGKQKQLCGSTSSLAVDGSGNAINYTVPGGKTLKAYGLAFNVYAATAEDRDKNQIGYVALSLGATALIQLGGNGGGALCFSAPIRYTAGQQCRVVGYNKANHAVYIGAGVLATEV